MAKWYIYKDIWFNVVWCKEGMRISTSTNIRFQAEFIYSFTDSDIIHKPRWVGVFFAFINHIFVWSSLCFWKSLFLELSRISNSITVRRKIAVKISMLSVVFQSNMTVWGQTDLWIVSNHHERPGGSNGHELTSYLPLWSMVNSFLSFCLTIVVHVNFKVDGLKNFDAVLKSSTILYMCWTMNRLMNRWRF